MARRASLAILAATAAVGAAGCGGDDGAADAATSHVPVDARPSRQVAATTHALRARPVARGFAPITGLVVDPASRRTLVVEQRGTARWLVGDGPAAGAPFLDLRSVVRSEGEQGLLGVAFLPGTPRRVAVHHSDADGDTRVAIYRIRGGRVDAASGRTILAVEQPYANHNGGALAVGRDGRLYLGLGDGGSAYDPRQNAQDLTSRLGKILRYDLPARRPAWRIVAYGLRNPWQTTVDPATGDLWIGDVGQDAVEEVDRLPAARLRPTGKPVNFGWAAYEGARRQHGKDLDRTGPLTWPVASYTHRDGCSVTGGVVVRRAGSRTPAALRDRYVFGDFCSGKVWSVPAAGRKRAMRREAATVARQTAYVQEASGRVLVATSNGTIATLR